MKLNPILIYPAMIIGGVGLIYLKTINSIWGWVGVIFFLLGFIGLVQHLNKK